MCMLTTDISILCQNYELLLLLKKCSFSLEKYDYRVANEELYFS